MVCGRRGVDKSTCLHFLDNCLLSATETYFDSTATVTTSTTTKHNTDCAVSIVFSDILKLSVGSAQELAFAKYRRIQLNSG